MESDHDSPPISKCLNWIDEGLWPEILKRLPIGILYRLRRVCKSWNSIISSAFFIKLHRSFTSSMMPDDLKSYLQAKFYSKIHDPYSLILYPPTKSLADDYQTQNLRFPFRCSWNARFTFVDVIRGVICVSFTSHSSYDSNILWNPTIHKYVVLPCSRFYSNFIGFGYDYRKNDFKVVRIWSLSDSIQHPYEVYSTRDGIWRKSKTYINFKSRKIVHINADRTSYFVNGTIHWLIPTRAITSNIVRYIMVMFDCESKEFKTMSFPEEVYPDYLKTCASLRIQLSEYKGMLSALVHSKVSYYVEMWVMEKHGVATTWKKLHRWEKIYIGSKLRHMDVGELGTRMKLAPYVPKEWITTHCISDLYRRFEEILSLHVYEETMFLMDDTKSLFYSKEEYIHISKA